MMMTMMQSEKRADIFHPVETLAYTDYMKKVDMFHFCMTDEVSCI